MARSLSRCIFRFSSNFPIHKLFAPMNPGAFRLVPIRNESTHSENPGVGGGDANEAMQRMEDAIHRIVVDRCAPDWLPFQPGSSYWVPPSRQSYKTAVLVQKLASSLTNEEVMSIAAARVRPPSSDGLSPNLVEADITSANTPKSQNEEEE